MREKLVLSDATERVRQFILDNGPAKPEVMLPVGDMVYARFRLSFGCEVELHVTFKAAKEKQQVEPVIRGVTVKPVIEISQCSMSATIEEAFPRIVLLQKVFEMGALLKGWLDQYEVVQPFKK